MVLFHEQISSIGTKGSLSHTLYIVNFKHRTTFIGDIRSFMIHEKNDAQYLKEYSVIGFFAQLTNPSNHNFYWFVDFNSVIY